MELIKFHDQYVCCDMPIEFKDYIGPSQDIPVRILPMKRRIRDILSLNETGQRVDRMDLIVCLQRHNCKMGRCLKEWKEHKICCRFKFPKEISSDTCIRYSRGKINGKEIGPWQLEIVGKRVNDQLINNHNSEILKLWRANGDFSITYDAAKVERYICKYTTKSEISSEVFKCAYDEVFSKAIDGETNTHLALKRVMTKIMGERDVSLSEALHTLQDINLHNSNVTVLRVSLENSSEVINNENNDIEYSDSIYTLYAGRKALTQFPESVPMNYLEFCRNYETIKKPEKLKRRTNPNKYAVLIWQRFSPNPRNSQYHLHCKYQLLRYKAWVNSYTDVLGHFSNNPEGWVLAWQFFLNPDEGKRKMPSWEKILNDAKIFVETCDIDNDDEFGDNDDDIGTDEVEEQEEWMKVQNLKDSGLDTPDVSNEAQDYWAGHRAEYAEEFLKGIDDWIPNMKKDFHVIETCRPRILYSGLNGEQKRVFNIVKLHSEKLLAEQLLLRIEGTAGTGKSHVINALCNILPVTSYFVAAPTGRASNNIGGFKIHSLLHWINNRTIKGVQLRILQSKLEKNCLSNNRRVQYVRL
jgi:hypothetical protein